MKIRPNNWINEDARRPVLVTLTALAACMTAWLVWMDQALVTDAAPNGIVSFELARTFARSTAILESWSDHAQSVAMLVQGADYLYLLVYPAWFSLSADMLGSRLGGSWQRIGFAISWLVLLAIPLDAIENYALIQQLLYGPSAFHAALAWWCAVPKFGLVGLAAGFLLLAMGTRLVRGSSR
ncbi:MAG: hypothetical protein QNI86_13760 [Halieaceae bacterium]|nr:hypothetical protein [Halieaceae bacterium]